MRNRTTFFLIFAFCTINFSLAQPVIKWQKSFGGSLSDLANSISRTNDLGFIIAGTSNSLDGDVTGNHGNNDYWIVKLDSAGALQWQKSLGGTAFDEARSIQQTTDGGYIVAGAAHSTNGDVTNHNGPGSDYWIVKLDNAGTIQWQKALGGNGDDAAASVRQTADGGYIVAGSSASNDSDVAVHYGSPGVHDYWIVKLNSAGLIQWQKTLGGSLEDYAKSVLQTSDGGYIVSGYSHSNDSDVTNHHGIGNADYWIVKIDSAGTIQWEKSLGGTSNDYAQFAEQTFDGGYIIAGYSASNDSDVTQNHGYDDYWIVKLDSAGSLLWQKSLGGTDVDYAHYIQQAADSGYVVSGFTWSDDGDVTGNHNTHRDCWVVKLDTLGNIEWEKALGGTTDEMGYSVCQSPDGSYAIAGMANSTDGDLNSNHGGFDMWILKLTEKYNSITGKLFIDANLNGVYDVSETLLANRMVTESVTGEFKFSRQSGDYNVYVYSPGNFSVAPAPMSYYNIVPANHAAAFSGFRQTDSLNDFAFQQVGAFNDLSVIITPASRFRPYFTATYVIDYYNAGTTTLSPSITFFPDNHLIFSSANVTPSTITSDSVIWNLAPLLPYQRGSIWVTVGVLGTTPINTNISSNVRINPVANDANSSNNYASCNVIATGSFDPNEMLVDRDTIFTTELASPPHLEYIINFQNTGNDTAFNVKVVSPVDTSLIQLSTLEFVSSSHPMEINYMSWTGKLEFVFANIFLPDSNVNEPASHGYVRYRIKPKSTLVAGDSIVEYANIFFDYNAPVLTNSVFTQIIYPTHVNEITPDNPVMIFPNPFNRQAVITFDNPKQELHAFSLYDVTGREVEKFNTTFGNILLEKGNKTNGVYFVQLTNFKSDSKIFGKLIISGQ